MRVGRYTLPDDQRPKSNGLGRLLGGLLHSIVETTQRAAVGVGLGVSLGGIISLWIVLQSLLRRTFYYQEFAQSTWEMVGYYLLGGAVVGCVAGIVWPLNRWWGGAAAVGIVSLAPAYAGAAYLIDGPGIDWSAVGFLSLIVGVPVGVGWRYLWRKIDPFGPL